MGRTVMPRPLVLVGKCRANLKVSVRLLAPIFHAGVWMGNRARYKELSDLGG